MQRCIWLYKYLSTPQIITFYCRPNAKAQQSYWTEFGKLRPAVLDIVFVFAGCIFYLQSGAMRFFSFREELLGFLCAGCKYFESREVLIFAEWIVCVENVDEWMHLYHYKIQIKANGSRPCWGQKYPGWITYIWWLNSSRLVRNGIKL